MGWSTKSVFGIVKIPVIEATAGLFDHLSQERLAKNFCPGAPILKFPTYRNIPKSFFAGIRDFDQIQPRGGAALQ